MRVVAAPGRPAAQHTRINVLDWLRQQAAASLCSEARVVHLLFVAVVVLLCAHGQVGRVLLLLPLRRFEALLNDREGALLRVNTCRINLAGQGGAQVAGRPGCLRGLAILKAGCLRVFLISLIIAGCCGSCGRLGVVLSVCCCPLYALAPATHWGPGSNPTEAILCPVKAPVGAGAGGRQAKTISCSFLLLVTVASRTLPENELDLQKRLLRP